MTIWLAKYQPKLTRWYNKDVKRKQFSAGDLVLWKVVGNTRDTSVGKLASTWEGSYRITTIVGVRAYYLEDLDARPLPQP